MIRRTKFFSSFVSAQIQTTVFCALVLSGSFASGSLAVGADIPRSKGNGPTTLRVEVQDVHGTVLADSGRGSRGSAVLDFNRVYQPGDRIVVSGSQQMAIRVDDWMPECVVYLAKTPHMEFFFDIPYGQGEGQTRSPFSQDSFSGASHRVTARALTAQELSGYRNLARNACDAELQPPAVEGTAAQKQAVLFPHASTNSVSRSLPDFRARNAIDGMTQNGHHGIWPYQSWGPELRTDLWWKVDFGRSVELDKVRLMVRADFPHDSYWQRAVIEFSDGSELPIEISQSAELQDFTFPKRNVSWVRLNKLVAADPAKWCSFMEVEAWGRELK